MNHLIGKRNSTHQEKHLAAAIRWPCGKSDMGIGNRLSAKVCKEQSGPSNLGLRRWQEPDARHLYHFSGNDGFFFQWHCKLLLSHMVYLCLGKVQD